MFYMIIFIIPYKRLGKLILIPMIPRPKRMQVCIRLKFNLIVRKVGWYIQLHKVL